MLLSASFSTSISTRKTLTWPLLASQASKPMLGEGDTEGDTEWLGLVLGLAEGDRERLGETEDEGDWEGLMLGDRLGDPDGLRLGDSDGLRLGLIDGEKLIIPP